MRAVVFTGPSIDAASVAEIARVELRPPIKRGDIDALLAEPEPPTHIGIVDGQFLHGLMISPKEILRALDRRTPVRVFGSSSMGALRATELAGEGMVGVGRIFELYRSGAVEADDEVAIAFDPETLRPVCEPMVNIRIALAAAVAQGVVDEDLAERAVALAKARYFPERSYEGILRELEAMGHDVTAMRDFLGDRAPDAKREDAVALLRQLTQP
ncbi:TfuA-like protein [Spongiactinospora sp. TRM90649]|uniref:TfuA-like protein n=1 Tax=Spongiactinospora sp. TRM90649 TaxID=3031114 RepID=UPI0023F751A4|nr:TfuA-like protein [Spongiactinospora sp. TRM90649]MDF5756342.1 TfuA-like protein [Spongiactinospora sp. TRM90649]